jgi:predicted DNA-binding transcriptional regulator AlpA
MPRLVAVEDLIDATTVAAAVGLAHRNSVATYLDRYHDFPRPVVEAGPGRCRLWSRKEIDRWMATRRRAGKVRLR